MFFHGWESLLRVSVSAAVAYLVIVAALRVFGQQSLAKMSGFDLVVSVALGSLLASIPLTESISVADGTVAVVTLLLLQELTRRVQARSLRVHHLVRQRPKVVVWDGRFLDDNMREINVTADEVRAAIRRSGMLSVSEAQAVVLENDGEWSVIGRHEDSDLSALHGLDIPGVRRAADDVPPIPRPDDPRTLHPGDEDRAPGGGAGDAAPRAKQAPPAGRPV